MFFGLIVTTKKNLNYHVKNTFKIWSKDSGCYLVKNEINDEYEGKKKYSLEYSESSHEATTFTFENARKLCLEHNSGSDIDFMLVPQPD